MDGKLRKDRLFDFARDWNNRRVQQPNNRTFDWLSAGKMNLTVP